MTLAISIVTPVITSGLGPAAPYGVNALQHRTPLRICYTFCSTEKIQGIHSWYGADGPSPLVIIGVTMESATVIRQF